LSNNELTKVIRCDQCRFAEPFIDPFTGKHRLQCGNNIWAVDAIGGYAEGADPTLWGDVTWELMSDRFGGCEFGKRKDENIRTITTEPGHISGQSQ